MYRTARPFIAVLTASCFLFSFILPEPLQAAVTLGTEKPATALPQAPAGQNIVLPFSDGWVSCGRYAGDRRLVVHLMDLHCNPGVQEAIARVIGALDRRRGVTRIYVEGAPRGEAGTGLIARFPDRAIRERLLRRLVDAGLMGGAEYFAETNGGRTLYGLEERDAYDGNVRRYAVLLARRQERLLLVRSLRARLAALERRRLSPPLRRLERLASGVEKGQDPSRLMRYAARSGEDLSRYPQLSRYLSLLEWQRSRPGRDLERLVRELGRTAPFTAYRALVSDPALRSDPVSFCAAVHEAGVRYAPAALRRYPRLAAWLALARDAAAFNPAALPDEERALVEGLRKKLSSTPQDADLVFLSSYAALLENAAELSLSRADYLRFISGGDRFFALLAAYLPGEDARLREFAGDPDLRAFYEANLSRSGHFIRAVEEDGGGTPGAAAAGGGADLLARLDGFERVDVMVTGGFHDDLADELAARGISCLCIVPNGGGDAGMRNYDRIVSGAYSLEDVFSSALAVRAARWLDIGDPRFNDDFALLLLELSRAAFDDEKRAPAEVERLFEEWKKDAPYPQLGDLAVTFDPAASLLVLEARGNRLELSVGKDGILRAAANGETLAERFDRRRGFPGRLPAQAVSLAGRSFPGTAAVSRFAGALARKEAPAEDAGEVPLEAAENAASLLGRQLSEDGDVISLMRGEAASLLCVPEAKLACVIASPRPGAARRAAVSATAAGNFSLSLPGYVYEALNAQAPSERQRTARALARYAALSYLALRRPNSRLAGGVSGLFTGYLSRSRGMTPQQARRPGARSPEAFDGFLGEFLGSGRAREDSPALFELLKDHAALERFLSGAEQARRSFLSRRLGEVKDMVSGIVRNEADAGASMRWLRDGIWKAASLAGHGALTARIDRGAFNLFYALALAPLIEVGGAFLMGALLPGGVMAVWGVFCIGHLLDYYLRHGLTFDGRGFANLVFGMSVAVVNAAFLISPSILRSAGVYAAVNAFFTGATALVLTHAGPRAGPGTAEAGVPSARSLRGIGWFLLATQLVQGFVLFRTAYSYLWDSATRTMAYINAGPVVQLFERLFEATQPLKDSLPGNFVDWYLNDIIIMPSIFLVAGSAFLLAHVNSRKAMEGRPFLTRLYFGLMQFSFAAVYLPGMAYYHLIRDPVITGTLVSAAATVAVVKALGAPLRKRFPSWLGNPVSFHLAALAVFETFVHVLDEVWQLSGVGGVYDPLDLVFELLAVAASTFLVTRGLELALAGFSRRPPPAQPSGTEERERLRVPPVAPSSVRLLLGAA